ncbi:MAG TPA: hypothetical protein PKM73_12935 [Verrucomicrobiota bacterium]|nr:hypothetical protein [Verrucomicrobiota bacterium]HNU49624.1 hypothetical protein [Verrucomicrobiota bacterium]
MDPQLPATPSPRCPWQPLTFRGVAGLAVTSPSRLRTVATLAALVLGGVILHYVATAWMPAIHTAVRQLPPAGEIRDGRLVWPTEGPVVLADTPRLTIQVDPRGTARDTQGSDWSITFGPTALRISSLLGMSEIPYPTAWIIALNRPEIEPRWGAWRPHLLLATALVSALGFLVLWNVLALLLSAPVKAYCLLLNRRSDGRCCRRLALAALLPGGLAMGLGLLGHTLGYLQPAELLLVFGIHLLVDLVYLTGAPWALPAAQSTFTPLPTAAPAPPRSSDKNPFAAPDSRARDRNTDRDGHDDA